MKGRKWNACELCRALRLTGMDAALLHAQLERGELAAQAEHWEHYRRACERLGLRPGLAAVPLDVLEQRVALHADALAFGVIPPGAPEDDSRMRIDRIGE